MNLWIETARDSLVRTIGTVDIVLMNDDEIRMLTEQPTLLRAAREVMDMGPSIVAVKQGEYGAALFTGDGFFSLPAYPLETVIDPTGAGDCFAGGFLGYLAAEGSPTDDASLRRAMTFGSVVASFNVEQFGTERVQTLTRSEIDERYEDFRRMTAIDRSRRSKRRAPVLLRREAAARPPMSACSMSGLGGLLARGGAEDPDRRAALHRWWAAKDPPDAWSPEDVRRRAPAATAPHPRLRSAASPAARPDRPRAAAPPRVRVGWAPGGGPARSSGRGSARRRCGARMS